MCECVINPFDVQQIVYVRTPHSIVSVNKFANVGSRILVLFLYNLPARNSVLRYIASALILHLTGTCYYLLPFSNLRRAVKMAR